MFERHAVEKMVKMLSGMGLPTRCLQHVLDSNYSFGRAFGISNVNVLFNSFNLHVDDRSALLHATLGKLDGSSTAVQTLYHEATHAFIDLMEEADNKAFLRFIEEGRKHYADAPMKGGGVAGDPNRLFQEAVASYVGYRVATAYGTHDFIEAMIRSLLELWEANETAPRDFFDRTKAAAREVPAKYAEQMQRARFGYDYIGWIGFREQTDTKRKLSDSLRDFCDEKILDNGVKDLFTQDSNLVDRLQRLLDRIEYQRDLIPFVIMDAH